MSWWSDVHERVRALLFRSERERWLGEEIEFHLEMETQKNLRSGLAPAEARRAAVVAFGGTDRYAEEVRDARGVRPLEDFAQDVRYALRTMRRTPGFTLIAILVLGLGIGANTAIFSAVNAVVLRALPLHDPDRLYVIGEDNPEKGWSMQSAAPANYLDWKEQVSAFQDVAAYTELSRSASDVVLTGVGAPQVMHAVQTTGNFFSVLGVQPALGRALREEETWNTSERVLVLSHAAWQSRFGGDRLIVGRVVQLDGSGVRVVGVMPPSFAFPSDVVEAWLPMRWDPADRVEIFFRRAHWIRVVARLAPGVSPAVANQELQAVVARLEQQYPETNRVMGASMRPLREYVMGDAKTPLLVLFGAVGLLLLIACANVGNLLLVKASGRQRELAVRAALGARRMRIVRQLLTESLALSLLGGAAGLAIGWAGTRLLERLQPTDLLPVDRFHTDLRVIGYSLAIALISGLVFGAAPALWTARRGSAAAMRQVRSGGISRGTRRLAGALVVGEVAIAVLLLTGAALLVKSFWRLQTSDPGFEGTGVHAFTLALPGSRYGSTEQVLAFYHELRDKAAALPGVEGAAIASHLPLTGAFYISDFAIPGRDREDYGSEINHRTVTPEYFGLLRHTLLRGRTFTAADRADSEPVIILNDAVARRFFPDQDPVGQRIAFDKYPDSTSTWYTIIGVVRGARQYAAEPPRIEAYHAFAQGGGRYMSLVVRSRQHLAALLPLLRSTIHQQDPELAIRAERSMDEVRNLATARERFMMALLSLFAAVAIVLAIVGVYGVTAQAARERTQEIGIRLALGARAADVLSLMVRQGMIMIGAGLLIGVAAGLIGTRALASLLYETTPTDPLTFAGVTAALALAGALASWWPALRASRVDPAIALKT